MDNQGNKQQRKRTKSGSPNVHTTNQKKEKSKKHETPPSPLAFGWRGNETIGGRSAHHHHHHPRAEQEPKVETGDRVPPPLLIGADENLSRNQSSSPLRPPPWRYAPSTQLNLPSPLDIRQTPENVSLNFPLAEPHHARLWHTHVSI